MEGPDAWWEVRCTAPGVLETVELPWGEPPQGAVRREESFSFVVDSTETGVRKLPTFFFGRAQLYADRNLDNVTAILATLATRIVAYADHPLYLFTACKLGDKWGLYGRDFFNRAIFRRRLERLGMEFSSDPFVRFSSSGDFSSFDWGTFRPEFLILGLTRVDPPPIMRLAGGPLFYTMNTFRLGNLNREEFHALGKLLPKLDALNSKDPATLIEALRIGA